MKARVVSLKTALPTVASEETSAHSTRADRTKTSFVALHFDDAGKGRIVSLPYGATLRVIGPSSQLPDGFEVKFEDLVYNVFETDLVARSILTSDPTQGARHGTLRVGENDGKLLPMRRSN
jgi:hypothetical protein